MVASLSCCVESIRMLRGKV
jgi:hypothetical protein